MKCPKCNTELQENSKFCNNCGFHISEAEPAGTGTSKTVKKKSKLPKILLIVLVSLLIVAGGITLFVLLQQPVKKVMTAFNNNDLVSAKEIYEKDVVDDDKKYNELVSLLNDKLSAAIDDYNNNGITYEEVDNIVNNIYQLGIIDISANAEKLGKLKASKDAMNNAKGLADKLKFADAVKEFRKVIKEDKDYEKAQSLINDTIASYKKSVLDAADAKLNTEDYPAALEILGNALKDELLSEDADLKSKQKEISDTYHTKSVTGINDLINSGDLPGAYDKATKLLTGYFLGDEEINGLRDNVKETLVSNALAKADQMINDGKYQDAINCLDNNMKYDYSSKLSNKKAEIEKTFRESRVKELKQYVTVSYDDVNENYLIVPKGYSTRYINVDENINVESAIIVNSIAAFTLRFGFEQDDWIFMDSIKIAADDYRTTINVGPLEGETQVIGGGEIAEWYNVLHTSLIDLNGGLDLEGIINKISNSDKATIRFNGQGYRDHTVTKSEKTNLKVFWELYSLLDEDPSLINILK